MWASIDQDVFATTAPDTPLMFVPECLLIPLNGLEWEQTDQLTPSSGLETLSGLQASALKHMLTLYEHTNKLIEAQACMPGLALPSDSALARLISAGHPDWLGCRPHSVIHTFLSSRSINLGKDAEANPTHALMPLLDVLNHQAAGAIFNVQADGVRVKAKLQGNSNECFVSYGYKDVMSLLLHYGYVAQEPRCVQSITCEVFAEEFGHLSIKDQGQRLNTSKDLPFVKIEPNGMVISHLNLDTDKPKHAYEVLRLMGTGLKLTNLDMGAEKIHNAVLEENISFYKKLEMLSADAIHTPKTALIASMLFDVARHQLALLNELTKAKPTARPPPPA